MLNEQCAVCGYTRPTRKDGGAGGRETWLFLPSTYMSMYRSAQAVRTLQLWLQLSRITDFIYSFGTNYGSFTFGTGAFSSATGGSSLLDLYSKCMCRTNSPATHRTTAITSSANPTA